MKYWINIFNLYLLVLTCLPCSDVHAAGATDPTTPISITEDHDHCPHETGDDHCPPFCVCSCCGQAIYFQGIWVFHLMPTLNLEVIKSPRPTTSSQIILQEVLLAVWRPPIV